MLTKTQVKKLVNAELLRAKVTGVEMAREEAEEIVTLWEEYFNNTYNEHHPVVFQEAYAEALEEGVCAESAVERAKEVAGAGAREYAIEEAAQYERALAKGFRGVKATSQDGDSSAEE